MKQIGILFQAEMSRAILADRKTLTSRLRGLEKLNEGYYRDRIDKVECRDGVWCFWEVGHGSSALPVFTARCPYGHAGDLLIGRETWLSRAQGKEALYRADFDLTEAAGIGGMYGGWKSSMVMPWSLSRLRLPVVETWPARLQNMTAAMAIEEGVDSLAAYVSLWGKINPAEPWSSNPWVWRVRFRRKEVFARH